MASAASTAEAITPVRYGRRKPRRRRNVSITSGNIVGRDACGPVRQLPPPAHRAHHPRLVVLALPALEDGPRLSALSAPAGGGMQGMGATVALPLVAAILSGWVAEPPAKVAYGPAPSPTAGASMTSRAEPRRACRSRARWRRS